LRHDPFEEKNLMVYEKDVVSEGLRELARAFFVKCFKENPAVKMVRLRTKHGLVNKLLDRIKSSEW